METVSKSPSPKTPVVLIFTGGARGCCGCVSIMLLCLGNQNQPSPFFSLPPASFRLNFLAGRKVAAKTLRKVVANPILSC